MVLRDSTKKLDAQRYTGYVMILLQLAMLVSLAVMFKRTRDGLTAFQGAAEAVNEVGIATLCILELSILRSEGDLRKRRPIFHIMAAGGLYMYAAAILWLADRRPEIYMLEVAANTVYLICPVLIGVLFWWFLIVWYGEETVPERWTTRGILILAGLYLVMILLNLRFGWLFTVDSVTGAYSRGAGYAVTLIVPAMILLTSIVRILTIRMAALPKAILLTYLLLPYIDSILWAGNVITVMTSSMSYLAIVFLYSNLYLNRERALDEHARVLAEARANAMLLQINPHFIYNTLGSIDSLCATDPEAARDLIRKFSLYLQSNYRELSRQPMIPFSEELENLRIYLSIEQVRFPSLKTEFDIRALDFMIPALSVQPLAENAVKHGICQRKGHRGTLAVSSWETEGSFLVSVRDDGVGFDPAGASLSEGAHLGIRNVTDRLGLLCGGTLTVRSTPGEGTECVISIPKEVRG